MRTFLFGFSLFVVCFAPPALAREVLVRAPADGADAVPAIRAALEQARRDGATVLRFENAIYHLRRERADERFLHVANHDDGLRRIGVLLDGWSNLRVEGGGAKFIVHGHLIPFRLEHCRDVVVTNVTIDWAEPFFFQGRVVAVDPAADSFDLEPEPESRARLTNGQLLFGEGDPRNREGWWQNLEWSYWVDPETKAAARLQPVVTLWNAKRAVPARTEKVGENRYRLTHATNFLPEPGAVLVSKGNREDNRISPAIHVIRSADVRFENVTIHHAGGMGLIAERTENVTLRRFNVTLPPDSRRLVSTTADATHFLLCRGEVVIEDSLFENMLDDATNVHGVYALVRDQTGSHSLEAGLHHFQQLGVDFAEPGDVLRFAAKDTLLPYGTRTVRSVRRLNQQRMAIEFTEPLDGFLQPNSAVDNVTWEAGLVFRRNHVRNNRARSVLVTTSRPSVIEDNLFERPSMMSILVEGDTHFWHESGPVADLVIRRNVFTGLHPSAALLRLRPMQPGEERLLPPYHRNIRVEDNTFHVVHPLVLEAVRVGGLTFERNRVEVVPGVSLKEGPAVILRACDDVVLRKNNFGFGAPLQVEPATTPVVLQENTGLQAPR